MLADRKTISINSISPNPKKTVQEKTRQLLFAWWPFLALLPHVILAAYLGNHFVPYPDQEAYLDGARNILAGRGLSISWDALGGFVRKNEPTSYFGAGTQLFLAAEMKLF